MILQRLQRRLQREWQQITQPSDFAIRLGVEQLERDRDRHLDLRVLAGRVPVLDESALDARINEGMTLIQSGRDTEARIPLLRGIAGTGDFAETDTLPLQITPLARDGVIVVAQVAINYLPIFRVWAHHMRVLGVDNILVIALDPLMKRVAEQMGFVVYHLPIFGFQNNVRLLIWTKTLEVRHRILENDYAYLHTDIDAIWHEDVRPDFAILGTDVVASEEFGSPHDVSSVWGFVPCLGLYRMNPTPASKAFYPRYMRRTRTEQFDQNAFNRLLAEDGARWTNNTDGGHHTAPPTAPLTIITRDQRVSARPGPTSPHENTVPARAKVIHPELPIGGGMVEKLSTLERFGVDVSMAFGRT